MIWLIIGIVAIFILGIAASVITSLIKKSIVQVNPGEVAFVRHWGHVENKDAPLKSGFHHVNPISKKIDKVSTKMTAQTLKPYQVFTKDDVVIGITVTIRYYVSDPYQFEYKAKYPIFQVSEIIKSALRNTIGNMQFQDAINQSKKINDAMSQAINGDTSDYGVTVKHVNIESLMPNQDVLSRMNSKKEANLTAESAVATERGSQSVVEMSADASASASIAHASASAKAANYNADASSYAVKQSVAAKTNRIKSMAGADSNSTSVSADAKAGAINKIADAQKNLIDRKNEAYKIMTPNYLKVISISKWSRAWEAILNSPSKVIMTDKNNPVAPIARAAYDWALGKHMPQPSAGASKPSGLASSSSMTSADGSDSSAPSSDSNDSINFTKDN